MSMAQVVPRQRPGLDTNHHSQQGTPQIQVKGVSRSSQGGGDVDGSRSSEESDRLKTPSSTPDLGDRLIKDRSPLADMLYLRWLDGLKIKWPGA